MAKRSTHRLRPSLSTFERAFLSISDILTVAMIILDLSFLSGMIDIDLSVMLVANLVMVGCSFVGYQIKKRARRRLEREIEQGEKDEATQSLA